MSEPFMEQYGYKPGGTVSMSGRDGPWTATIEKCYGWGYHVVLKHMNYEPMRTWHFTLKSAEKYARKALAKYNYKPDTWAVEERSAIRKVGE